jgi:hypothetical protein
MLGLYVCCAEIVDGMDWVGRAGGDGGYSMGHDAK